MQKHDPLRLVGEVARKYNGSPYYSNNGEFKAVRFSMWGDNRYSASCCILPVEGALLFSVCLHHFPQSASKDLEATHQFLQQLNEKLDAERGFHWGTDGYFELTPEQRYPVFHSTLPRAAMRTQREVEIFCLGIERQVDEIRPVFELAYLRGVFPPEPWLRLLLSQSFGKPH